MKISSTLPVTLVLLKGGAGASVSVQDSGTNSPGLSPCWGRCAVYLCKPLSSHSASLHPGVNMGTSKFIAVKREGNPVMDSLHSIQG